MIRVASAALILIGLIGGCTWGTYDGTADAGDAGGDGNAPDGSSSTTIDPVTGGIVTSSDKLFEVAFPPKSLSARADVSIVAGPSGCTATTFAGKCWSSGYVVELGAARLTGTVAVSFFLSKSSFMGMPQNQTFIVKLSSGWQAMPGVWDPAGDVSGLQGLDTSSMSTLGPYLIVSVGSPSLPSSSACGTAGDVCDPCAQGCGANTFAPALGSGIHEACMISGQSPSTDTCLGDCLNGSPQAETCP